MSGTAGGVVGGSLARYDPFGGYRTRPSIAANGTLPITRLEAVYLSGLRTLSDFGKALP